MGLHFRVQCKHGTLIRTCRCHNPNKQIITEPCPAHCPKKDEDIIAEIKIEGQYTISGVAGVWVAMEVHMSGPNGSSRLVELITLDEYRALVAFRAQQKPYGGEGVAQWLKR